MLEPCAVKVASTVLRRGLHREMGFLSDYNRDDDLYFTHRYSTLKLRNKFSY